MKPLVSNCSLHLRGAAEWAGGQSALPQNYKVLLPPELAVFIAVLGQLGSLIAVEMTQLFMGVKDRSRCGPDSVTKPRYHCPFPAVNTNQCGRGLVRGRSQQNPAFARCEPAPYL